MRRLISASVPILCTWSASATMKPTRLRWFRLAYGSWKIIIGSRRIGRISVRFRWVMSRPAKVIRPLVGSSSRIRQRAIVDLPQPDSPTTPRVSPCLTVKLIPSTALTAATSFWKTIPRVTGKYLTRSSTTRRSSPEWLPFMDTSADLRQRAFEELHDLAVLRLLVEVACLQVMRLVRDRQQRGLRRLADLHHVGTARMEAAPLGRVQQRGRLALDLDEPLHVRVDAGQPAEQAPGVR